MSWCPVRTASRSFTPNDRRRERLYVDAMQISAHLTWSTAEASASGSQVTNALIASVADIARTKPVFEKIDRLELGLALNHPVTASHPNPGKARFHTPSKTVFASASIDYEKWIAENWNSRVDAVAEALIAAVGAVAKSRLTTEERATALDVIRDGAERTKLSPPQCITPLGSVYLMFYAGSEKPAVSFNDHVPPMIPGVVRIEELPPSAVPEYLSTSPNLSTPPPSIFKLYTQQNGQLTYREGWIADGKVTEHWGVCGERGETRFHPLAEGTDPRTLLNALSREARALGFKPIPLSRHKGLIVERPVQGFGSPEDLDLRHELQAFLDDKLGWLGLGHCDGGSSGSGTMEAYCLVVDDALAVEAITRELAASPFTDFSVRASPDGS